jgi:predicted transcriptional regulator
MAKAKTAISIDDHLLEETGQIAQELDVSRSQIVSLALEEYIQRYRNKQILKQINDAYSDEMDADEIGSMKIMRSHRKKPGKDNEWK